MQSSIRSADDALASFHANVMPLLDAAFSFARFLTRDADSARDIAQRAILQAHRDFDEHRGGDVRTWLFKIVRDRYQGWLTDRRSKSGPDPESCDTGVLEKPSIVEPASDEDAPEFAMRDMLGPDAIRSIIDTMPRPLREIMVLREIEKLSYHQIAEITSLPISTVMIRLGEARRKFGTVWRGRKKSDRPLAETT